MEITQIITIPTETTPTEITPTEITPTEIIRMEITQMEITQMEIIPTILPTKQLLSFCRKHFSMMFRPQLHMLTFISPTLINPKSKI